MSVCNPIFEVRDPDLTDDEDWTEVKAIDFVQAAEEYAAQHDRDSGDYDIVGGDDAEVWVRMAGDTDVRKFIVSGESVPSYMAREKKD